LCWRFLNHLAFVHGMKPVFQFGAYVGTFGEYQQEAVVSDGVRYPDPDPEEMT
jgi:hypothetical protein